MIFQLPQKYDENMTKHPCCESVCLKTPDLMATIKHSDYLYSRSVLIIEG